MSNRSLAGLLSTLSFAFCALCFAPLAEAGVSPARFTDPNRQAKLESAFPELERVAARWAEERGVPGLAWGVVIDGELTMFGSVGSRQADEQMAIDEDTVFRIASMTKSFTGLAILKLRDEGKVDLDAPVAKYIPELASLAQPTRDSPPITVRHLLTHTAGFPEDNPWGDRQMELSEADLSRWLSSDIPFSTATGSSFEYSNYGYAMLGQVVSNVAGKSYNEYVNAEILGPLGLTSAVWEAGDIPADRLATGYRLQDEEDLLAEVPLGDGTFASMGGLFISSRDLAKWVALMLSAFPPRDDPESPPALRWSLREMQQGAGFPRIGISRSSPGASIVGVSSVYAFGLGSRWDCDLGWGVGHSGGFPGFGSNMAWLPEHGVGAFGMANLTYASPWKMVQEMLRVLHRTGGLEPRQAVPSRALTDASERVARLVDRWSDREAEAIAADNLFLDESLDRRREAINELRDGLGPCEAEPIAARNALRGSFRMNCEAGWLDVELTLAPTLPPSVQHLGVTGGRPPTPWMQEAIDDSLAAMVHGPDRLEVSESADVDGIGALLQLQRQEFGACVAGERQSGDGEKEATVRLTCDRGDVDMTLRLDEKKLTQIEFGPLPDQDCVR